MKIRFYTIQALYDEVKCFIRKTLRMQFLTRNYSQEYRTSDVTGEHTASLPMTEHILTLSVAQGEDIFYYSQPYLRYTTYEAKERKAEVEEKVKVLEDRVNEIFNTTPSMPKGKGMMIESGWTIKKGVYEP